MPNEIHLTPDGHNQLRRAVERERQRLAEAQRSLHAQLEGTADTEDSGLEDAKLERMRVEARLVELEEALARARIVEGDSTGRVAIGSVVVLHEERSGRELRVQLVSATEASMLVEGLGRVSERSPVGRELMGREVGETFEVRLAERHARYRVERLERSH